VTLSMGIFARVAAVLVGPANLVALAAVFGYAFEMGDAPRSCSQWWSPGL